MNQREIKFRSWNKYGMSKPVDIFDMSTCHGTIESYPDGTILMQFTGLHDKNGKEIYEGDIVYKRKTHNSRRIILLPKYRVQESYSEVVFETRGNLLTDDYGHQITGFLLKTIVGKFTPKIPIDVMPQNNSNVVTNDTIEVIVQKEGELQTFVDFTPNHDWKSEIEIIGNIYENPELLSAV